MSLTATARSIPGTRRQEVVIDGRHRLVTDQPEHLGGEGSGPSPHELLPAALAACVATTLCSYAKRKGWNLGNVWTEVDYHHHASPKRFEFRIQLDGALDGEQLARLEKVARACPVRRALDPSIELVESVQLVRRPVLRLVGAGSTSG